MQSLSHHQAFCHAEFLTVPLEKGPGHHDETTRPAIGRTVGEGVGRSAVKRKSQIHPRLHRSQRQTTLLSPRAGADEEIEDLREVLAAHHDESHTTLKGQ
jgi:hypothetical protein